MNAETEKTWPNDRGHVWTPNGYGGIEFEMGDSHYGPICVRCGYSFCAACDKGPLEDCEPDDAKPCQRCGQSMILHDTGRLLLTYPAMREREWWCACGEREKADPVTDFLPSDPMKRWREVNEPIVGSMPRGGAAEPTQ